MERSAGYRHLTAVALDIGDLHGAPAAIEDAIRLSRPRVKSSSIGLSHDLNVKGSILSETGETRRAFRWFVDVCRLMVFAAEGGSRCFDDDAAAGGGNFLRD